MAKEKNPTTPHLKVLLDILKSKGNELIANGKLDSWSDICSLASGKYFKYEYLQSPERLKVTEKSSKITLESPIL